MCDQLKLYLAFASSGLLATEFGRSLQVALKVGMSCQGCVGAVERVLKKMPGTSVSKMPMHTRSKLMFLAGFVIELDAGVESVSIDLPAQKVLVKGDVTPEAVVQQVSKTGKPTELWS